MISEQQIEKLQKLCEEYCFDFYEEGQKSKIFEWGNSLWKSSFWMEFSGIGLAYDKMWNQCT